MLKAVVFDFNGVILDDEEYHYEALKRVLAQEGVLITRRDYYRDCLGFDDRECFLWGLKGEENVHRAGGMDALVQRKFLYYEALLDKETRFFPGVCGLIRRVAAKYPLAVASMALRREIEMALEKASLTGLFSVIVSGEDVEKTKPDPEAYQRALAQLNGRRGGSPESSILPGHCLVIEDSVPGIRAAKRAGMRVLAVSHTVEAGMLAEADHVLDSLEGISLRDMEAIFADNGQHIS